METGTGSLFKKFSKIMVFERALNNISILFKDYPAVVAAPGPYVHSAPAPYSQPPSGAPPTRSTAPPTAYATHAAPVSANQVPNGASRDPRDGIGPRDPSQLTLAPSANRVFNVSTRPQQCNEPLYSSLPPPSNQPNQVIQPVSIHPFHHTVSKFIYAAFRPYNVG